MRQVRLGAELEGQFAAALLKHKLRPADLMRQAIEHELAALDASARPAPRRTAALAKPGAVVRIRRLTVRLPDFVFDAVRDRGRARGMAASRWISALVQSNVAAEPVLSEKETLVLEECSGELASIGRNINQIARVLNRESYEVERLRIDLLEYLDQVLKKTRSDIKSLVRASRNIWAAEELP